MTVLDIIKSSFRLLNVYASGETPSSDDSADALTTLNMMIGSWNNDGLMIYQVLNETFSLVNGTASYLIGAGQTFNTTRPNKIDSAYVRDTASNDFDVRLINSEEYGNIAEKTLTGVPSRMYYNAAYPYATMYFWPVPDAAYTLGLNQWKQISTFTDLVTTITLPPGYEMALRYCLAVELAPEFGKVVTADIASGAQQHKSAIMRINNRKPFMKIDSALLGQGQYNIYSDAYL